MAFVSYTPPPAHKFGHKAQSLASHSITVKVTSTTVWFVWAVEKGRLDLVTSQIQANSLISFASATPTLYCWWKVLRLLDWRRYYYRGNWLCVKLVYNGCEEDVSAEKREREWRDVITVGPGFHSARIIPDERCSAC